ncbi:FXYD domain-containing ion transport regulator 3 isoform X9 [Taeniopygia guttata]|uniref:FXYD domain-containing ion transport regulator 3 isoform X9 n=1 Tax=Taeniopygia guttata TaxID=59729 RepID=UPI001BC8A678|nr:FXYD domain-containing ion transport regulator 3 isoform X6 [Taeniopygia guttata]
MGESLSQWEAAEAGPAHSTPPVSPILSLARGDAPDWCHLRVGGLTVAAVLSVLGVVVLLSGKCKCRSKARCRHPPPELSPLAGTGA